MNNLTNRLNRLEGDYQARVPSNEELISYLQRQETLTERTKIELWLANAPENTELRAMSDEELEALLVEAGSPLVGVTAL